MHPARLFRFQPLMRVSALCVMLAVWLASPALLHAQAPVDPDQPYLSEIAPASDVGAPAWVELTVGRVEPGGVGAGAQLFLPSVQNAGGSAALAAALAPRADAPGALSLAGWRVADEDGNSYLLPANLPSLPKGTVVVVRFDGLGPAADEVDPADGTITLHTPAGLVAPFETAGDQVALYDNANKLVDFVAWGQPAAEDDDAAASAGLWSGETFVVYDGGFGVGAQPSPAAPNQSIGVWQDALEQGPKTWVPYTAAGSTPGKVNPPPTPLHATLPDGATVGVDLSSVAASATGTAINRGITVGWSGMDGNFDYEFELDDNADFSSPLVDVRVGDPAWSGLLPEGNFFWRTRLVDGRGKFGGYFGPFKVSVVDLGKFVSLGTIKTLLDPSEHKLQRKDTTMLDVGGGTNNIVGNNNAGDRRYPASMRWDGPHVDANGAASFGWNGIDNWYCVRASTAMINDFYGGTVSEDRISYYAFEELNQNWYGSPANLRGRPEHDLGFGVGIGDYAIQENVLNWALGNVGVSAINYCPPNPMDGNPYSCPNPNGAPMSFDAVRNFVDAGRPFMSVNLRNAHARVVDGYWDITPTMRWVHLIDPVPANTNTCNTCTNAQWIAYTTFANTHERTIVGPANVPNPRQDEASMSQDPDGDGISTFDETRRFGTDPFKYDTDGDLVSDKNDMAEYIFDVSAIGVYVYTPGMAPKTSDFDNDGLRKERDWDNDNDGVPDGCEDLNLDGEFDGGGETNNFSAASKQACQPRFFIVNPVSGQAANAGDPAAPDKVIIRMKLTLPPALPNAPTFTVAQFSATIGGKPAPNISGAQVGQEFWLVVQAPAQDAQAFYDLAVSFDGTPTGHNDQSDSESNAVYYIPRPRLDSMVVLDRSGSMLDDDKITAAKNAARLYVDQFAENDRIGVVSFADNATVDFALTTVQNNGAALTSAKNAINAAVANGQTAMGPGLLTGQQQLQASGGDDHNWSLMLLTDGQENVAPYWSDPAVSGVIVPSKTVVNTIGLGAPNAPYFGLLAQIAGSTGGTFGAVDDPSGLGAAAVEETEAAEAIAAFPTKTANQLADAYKYAAEQVLGEQRLYEDAGTVGGSNLADTHRFQVPAGLPSMVISANFDQANQGSIEVRDPAGNVIAANGASIIRRTDATHDQYRIGSPAAGLWSVQVKAALPTPLTEYVLFAAGDTPLTLTLAVGDVSTFTGASGIIGAAPVAAILADSQPVPGAVVQLQVVLPSGVGLTPITLLDDGAHNDGAANDGIYGGVVQMPNRGTYLLKAKATLGGAAYRYAQVTVSY